MQKELVEYIPLGSVVILKGGVQKVLVIARGIVAANMMPPVFFEYGGCLYPQGLTGDQILYFNQEDIKKVVFSGFSDDDDELMVENINEWYQKSEFEKGNVEEMKKFSEG